MKETLIEQRERENNELLIPKWPLNRLIYETDTCSKMCPECGSSLKRKFLFFKTSKCINSECKNYYERR